MTPAFIAWLLALVALVPACYLIKKTPGSAGAVICSWEVLILITTSFIMNLYLDTHTSWSLVSGMLTILIYSGLTSIHTGQWLDNRAEVKKWKTLDVYKTESGVTITVHRVSRYDNSSN